MKSGKSIGPNLFLNFYLKKILKVIPKSVLKLLFHVCFAYWKRGLKSIVNIVLKRRETSMKIFVLEDNDERIQFFKEKLGDIHTLTFSKKVPEAIEIIKNDEFTTFFLDHDLDDRTYVNSDEPNTGFQLCKWLKENPEYLPFQIFIHSMNSVGAQRMYDELKDLEHNSTLKELKIISFGELRFYL
jgi:CheY-like chemotaxis protein